jgi:Maltose acetyltransferase
MPHLLVNLCNSNLQSMCVTVMANSLEEEREKMVRGESFFASHPALVKDRQRTHQACYRYNNAGDVSRRRAVEMWRE